MLIQVEWSLSRSLPPRDCGYAVFGALSRAGLLSHADAAVQLLWPRGDRIAVRGDSEHLRPLLASGPMVLDVDGWRVRAGEARATAVRPSSSLRSVLVTIKGKTCDQDLRAAVLRQLDTMGVAAEVSVGRRGVVRVAGNRIIGYEVRLSGLSDGDSLRVLGRGVGGRTRFGCGVLETC